MEKTEREKERGAMAILLAAARRYTEAAAMQMEAAAEFRAQAVKAEADAAQLLIDAEEYETAAKKLEQ